MNQLFVWWFAFFQASSQHLHSGQKLQLHTRSCDMYWVFTGTLILLCRILSSNQPRHFEYTIVYFHLKLVGSPHFEIVFRSKEQMEFFHMEIQYHLLLQYTSNICSVHVHHPSSPSMDVIHGWHPRMTLLHPWMTSENGTFINEWGFYIYGWNLHPSDFW